MSNKTYYAIVNNGEICAITTNRRQLDENSQESSYKIYRINNYSDDFMLGVSTYRIESDNTLTCINEGSLYDECIRSINRSKRPEYLQAFDLWEKAVVRSREEDSPEIMQWYKDMLDLKPDAFKDENIPDRIKYYLGGN